MIHIMTDNESHTGVTGGTAAFEQAAQSSGAAQKKVAFHVVIYHEAVTALKWEFGMPSRVRVRRCIVPANTHFPVGHERLPNCPVTL